MKWLLVVFLLLAALSLVLWAVDGQGVYTSDELRVYAAQAYARNDHVTGALFTKQAAQVALEEQKAGKEPPVLAPRVLVKARHHRVTPAPTPGPTPKPSPTVTPNPTPAIAPWRPNPKLDSPLKFY